MNPPPLTPGTIYLVGTPLGNLEDVTLRALRVLAGADVLACEDTRLTRRLFARHNLAAPARVVACHEHNEARAAALLVEAARGGAVVAVCTDAGMPGVSDPGYRVAALARAEGVRVEAVPGPTAAATAVSVSGLPTSSFTFLGFPPKKAAARRRWLEAEKASRHTLVLYESPHRLAGLLGDAAAALGDRDAAVCLELTKKFERVRHGRLSALAASAAEATVRGEVTVVIAPAPGDDDNDG